MTSSEFAETFPAPAVEPLTDLQLAHMLRTRSLVGGLVASTVMIGAFFVDQKFGPSTDARVVGGVAAVATVSAQQLWQAANRWIAIEQQLQQHGH